MEGRAEADRLHEGQRAPGGAHAAGGKLAEVAAPAPEQRGLVHAAQPSSKPRSVTRYSAISSLLALPRCLTTQSMRAEPVADALAAHHQDGVGHRADVARRDLAGDEVLELGLLGGHQEQRGHRRVIVAVRVDEGAVLPHRHADLHPERLAVAMDGLPVEVVEDVGLDVVARHVHRLDAVHHDAPAPRREVEVHEGPHRVEGLVVLGLPVPVELDPVRARDLVVAQLADPRQRVAVEGLHLLVGRVRLGHGQHRVRPALEVPAVQPRGVGVVLLGVAADVHVEDDAAGPVGPGAVVAEPQAQVGLADAGGPVHDRQGARQQPAAQHLVQPGTARGYARGHRSGDLTDPGVRRSSRAAV